MKRDKYVIEILEGQQMTAGSKAKEDIVRFLVNDGFSKISFQAPKNKLRRLIFGKFYWKKFLKDVKDESIIIYQYPAYSRIMGDYFIEASKKKCITKIMVIHDLDSFRIYKDSPKDIKRELKFCNEFDVVVCHNDTMKKWLLSNGCTSQIISLNIFDYHEVIPVKDNKTEASIVFAGNLSKSEFISKIECKTPINLYGVYPKSHYKDNVMYQGAFDPSDLGNHLNGKYGLVWDGNSTDSCTGMTGEYMRINNPHKTSLYLTMGIPVIIWKEAALADFIVKNKLGIALRNLNHIDKELSKITEEQYLEFKKNSIDISKKLREGYFIKKAVRDALNLLN